MNLRRSYTLFAPVYDAVVAGFSEGVRRDALAGLGDGDLDVLLTGVGTGLDIPHLPPGNRYTGIDLTPAMLARAQRRCAGRDDVALDVGDVMALPYGDGRFDAVVAHLIIAVVPEPQRAFDEALRVLRPGGRLLVLDKFLRPGRVAPLRRALTPLTGRLATRLDVVFEELLATTTQPVAVARDEPVLAGGWFRRIELRKTGD